MTEWVLAFVVGFVLGFGSDRALMHRRKAHPVNTPKLRKPPPNWYEAYAPRIMVGLIVIVVVSFVVTVYGIREDQQQTEDFTANNRAILGCVGGWADAFTLSSQPVREAAIVRDEAVRVYRETQNRSADADRRQTQLFLEAITDPADTPAEEAAALEDFLRVLRGQERAAAAEDKAYDDLEAAEQFLENVRADNPLPEPVEIRCADYLDDGN